MSYTAWEQLDQYFILCASRLKYLGKKIISSSQGHTVRISALPVHPDSVPKTWLGKKLKHFNECKNAYIRPPDLVYQHPNFPSIYIGSEKSAAELSTYTDMDISIVFNCAKSVPIFVPDRIFIAHKIPMVDDRQYDINFVSDTRIRTFLFQSIRQVYEDQIKRAKEGLAPRKWLIHCAFGRSRSVAITIFILFLWYHYLGTPKKISEIYIDLQERRPVLELKQEFYVALEEFAREFESNELFRTQWLSVFAPEKIEQARLPETFDPHKKE